PRQIYPLSLHDALPISAFVDRHGVAIDAFSRAHQDFCLGVAGKFDRRFKDDHDWWPEFLEELGGFAPRAGNGTGPGEAARKPKRSEEHTSELQSPYDIV